VDNAHYFIISIYFNCKCVFSRWQWYYNKTQHTNNTTIKQNSTQNYTHNKHPTQNENKKLQLQQQAQPYPWVEKYGSLVVNSVPEYSHWHQHHWGIGFWTSDISLVVFNW
jgi:hypothetical protein